VTSRKEKGENCHEGGGKKKEGATGLRVRGSHSPLTKKERKRRDNTHPIKKGKKGV